MLTLCSAEPSDCSDFQIVEYGPSNDSVHLGVFAKSASTLQLLQVACASSVLQVTTSPRLSCQACCSLKILQVEYADLLCIREGRFEVLAAGGKALSIPNVQIFSKSLQDNVRSRFSNGSDRYDLDCCHKDTLIKECLDVLGRSPIRDEAQIWRLHVKCLELSWPAFCGVFRDHCKLQSLDLVPLHHLAQDLMLDVTTKHDAIRLGSLLIELDKFQSSSCSNLRDHWQRLLTPQMTSQ